MSKEKSIVPELRFPEFEKDGEWSSKKLGDLAAFSKGKGIGKADIAANGITPCIRYGELYTQYNETIDEVTSSTNIEKDDLVLSQANDVIIPASGETRIDIATASCVLNAGVALGSDLNIIRSKLNGVFLAYYLNNGKKMQIAKMAQGVSVIHLYSSQLKSLGVDIPKPKEQQKIADCLSSLDALIAAHRDKLDALREHKKGLMQNLFPQEGEMVPKLRFPEFEEDGEWEIRSVEQNIDLISGIALKSRELTEDNSGTPILRGVNITEGQIRHSAEMDRFYLGETSKMDKFLIQENDIVIGMDGSKVGKNVALISEKDAGAILIQRVARIRAIDSDVKYLYHNFLSNTFRRYVDSVNTSSGIPHISSKQIRDFEIGFPPTIQEQQKIADCLSAVDGLMAAQEDRIAQLQEHKRGLMQGLFPKTNV